MKDFADSLKPVFDKIADFFQVLDISFIISGFACFLVFPVWQYYNYDTIGINLGFSSVFSVILISYVLGLISFTAGRFIRRNGVSQQVIKFFTGSTLEEKYVGSVAEAIKFHKLTDTQPYKDYFAEHENAQNNVDYRKRVISYIIGRLWVVLRQNEEYSVSYSFINKYWQLSATYDGLAFSLLLWIVTLLELNYGFLGKNVLEVNCLGLAGVGVVIVILAVLCSRQAIKYEIYQAQELIESVTEKMVKKESSYSKKINHT